MGDEHNNYMGKEGKESLHNSRQIADHPYLELLGAHCQSPN
jgi:hypothetical protein